MAAVGGDAPPIAGGGTLTAPTPDQAVRQLPESPPPASVTGSAVPPASPRDEELVRQVLQRYQLAYDGLDARSARAVWPGVDEAALQRAFDGLQSQDLTFSDCRVDVRGNAGTAVCRGSTRYVTKIGSRDPRVESRVWNFRLRKAADEWLIESARAER